MDAEIQSKDSAGQILSKYHVGLEGQGMARIVPRQLQRSERSSSEAIASLSRSRGMVLTPGKDRKRR